MELFSRHAVETYIPLVVGFLANDGPIGQGDDGEDALRRLVVGESF
jgi:hypothetical protein